LHTGINIVSDNSQVWKPNVTVAAIAERDGRFLMVRELINGSETWNQPAGHLEPNETIEQAVVRETLEETSYQFFPRQLCGIYRIKPDPASDRTYLRFAFSGDVGDNLNQPLDADILSAEWMTLQQIRDTQSAHRTPLVLQCILDYLHKPSYPLQVFSSDFA
jgi:ADP-ribose pyrophosphatase YjhB (NUDIX family)